MQAFMEPDKIGLLPAGVGHKVEAAPEPELPSRPVFADVLASALGLTIEEQRWLYAALLKVMQEQARKDEAAERQRRSGFVRRLHPGFLAAAAEFEPIDIVTGECPGT